ncbi:hypothetical protein FJZ31_29355 [Candidatus Poribacteria bacterium]|nr:hypothetical protein [Candidatus Poribacteria bacterium]
MPCFSKSVLPYPITLSPPPPPSPPALDTALPAARYVRYAQQFASQTTLRSKPVLTSDTPHPNSRRTKSTGD